MAVPAARSEGEGQSGRCIAGGVGHDEPPQPHGDQLLRPGLQVLCLCAAGAAGSALCPTAAAQRYGEG